MIKVLFVGGGRRWDMVNLFKSKGCEVHCYEYGNYQPVSKICKVIQGKKWGECVGDLIDLSYLYDLVIPFMDAAVVDLYVVKSYFDTFWCNCDKCKNYRIDNNKPEKKPESIIVSPTCKICYNKKEFEKWMMKNYLCYYPYDSNSYNKKVVKPVFGYGSNGVFFVEGDSYISYEEEVIIQDYIDGEEYTVDCYVNKVGQCVGAVPRLRQRVDGGEVVDAKTVRDNFLIRKTKEIAEKLQIVGPACFQWIKQKNTENYFLIEVNSRFGGGAPLSIAAGFDMIQYCIEEYYLNDLVIESNVNWKSDVQMKRVYRSTFFNI